MQPEFFSAAFLSALFAIVLIDLVLAGDNALIIGLVVRQARQRRLTEAREQASEGRHQAKLDIVLQHLRRQPAGRGRRRQLLDDDADGLETGETSAFVL